MKTIASISLLASLAAVALADDQAFSVSTLDFKNRFVTSGIVPEVIAALDPAVSFYASYIANDGHRELLVPGASLSINGKFRWPDPPSTYRLIAGHRDQHALRIQRRESL